MVCMCIERSSETFGFAATAHTWPNPLLNEWPLLRKIGEDTCYAVMIMVALSGGDGGGSGEGDVDDDTQPLAQGHTWP